jgi:hypothetical protein
VCASLRAADAAADAPPRKKRRGAESRRGARFAPRPSAAVRERIARARAHRLYLLHAAPRQEAPEGWRQSFAVLGATANVYDVCISRTPSCSCPDAARGNICKHRLFVLLRVLRRREDDPLLWQRALLEAEVRDLLSALPAAAAAARDDDGDAAGDAGALATEALRQAYRARMSAPAARRPLGGSDCGVCYEALLPNDDGAEAEAMAWCAACGNATHAACFARWRAARAAQQQQQRDGIAAALLVTCVYCRAPWRQNDNSEDAAAAGGSAAYLSLRDVSAEHQGEGTRLEALYPDTAQWINRAAARRSAARALGCG